MAPVFDEPSGVGRKEAPADRSQQGPDAAIGAPSSRLSLGRFLLRMACLCFTGQVRWLRRSVPCVPLGRGMGPAVVVEVQPPGALIDGDGPSVLCVLDLPGLLESNQCVPEPLVLDAEFAADARPGQRGGRLL